jgi:hypothetical protein
LSSSSSGDRIRAANGDGVVRAAPDDSARPADIIGAVHAAHGEGFIRAGNGDEVAKRIIIIYLPCVRRLARALEERRPPSVAPAKQSSIIYLPRDAAVNPYRRRRAPLRAEYSHLPCFLGALVFMKYNKSILLAATVS